MNNFNNVHHFNIYGASQAETGEASNTAPTHEMGNPPEPNNFIRLNKHFPSPANENLARQLETNPHLMRATKHELLTQLVESEWRVIALKREVQKARTTAAIAQAQNAVTIARAEVAEAATKQAENKIKELAILEEHLTNELSKRYGI